MTTAHPSDGHANSQITQVLDEIEDHVVAEMRQESDSEFLRGRLSALHDVRAILAALQVE